MMYDRAPEIAEWLKNVRDPVTAWNIIREKRYDDNANNKHIFSNHDLDYKDKDKDDILLIASAAHNNAFKNLLSRIANKSFLEDPENDIFKGNDLDTDKLNAYREKHNKFYLDSVNILSVYECTYDDEEDGECSDDVYIIDFDNRKIHNLVYDQSDFGDEQEVSLLDKIVSF